MDVVALAEDDPRRERAHRGRDARLLARRDHREDEDHDRAREDLAASHASDAVEEARGRAPRDGDENRHARDREDDAARDGGGARPAPGDEGRQEEEDRDHGEVLEEGDREEPPAVRGRELVALLEDREDDRRGRDRDEEAEEDGLIRRAPPEPRERVASGGRQGHLQRAADERRPAEGLQAPDRELEADEEEDERDAELRDRLDAVRVADPPERVRPDRDPGDEKPDDLRELQPAADEEDGERRREDDREVPQERPLPHAVSIGTNARSARRTIMMT